MSATIHSTEPHIDAHETKRRHRIVIEFDSTLAGAIGRRDHLADAIRFSDALPVYDNVDVSQPTVVGDVDAELAETVRAAARAAYGDSNDAEVDALRDALESALIALGTTWDALTDGIDDEMDED